MDASKDIITFLDHALLHRPESIGLSLDPDGWISVDLLIAAADLSGHKLDRAQIQAVLAADTRQDYSLSADGQRIRANPARQAEEAPGETHPPPPHLYYPTSTRFLGAIHTGGLRSAPRRYLHLFDDLETAISLAPALAERVIITVLAGAMVERGYSFRRDDNGVWLTESVPPEFLL